MTEKALKNLIDELRALPSETEWVEFKEKRCEPNDVGEYVSALSNSACLHDKDKAYLVFGIKDKTHQVVGTSVKLKKMKIGNEELENWLSRLLSPHVDFKLVEFTYDKNLISMIIIDPASNHPIRFKGIAYIRVGSYKRKLSDFPEKNYSTVSRIISDSISEGLVSAYDEASKSRKFARYIPFWV